MGPTHWPLAEPGLWVETIGTGLSLPGRPALFLDRDGTVNVDTGYPSHPDEIQLRREIVPVIRAANIAGIPVVIVTNQSGIARAFFGWSSFEAVNARVLELLTLAGCSVQMVLACAYHDKGFAPYKVADHPMRKPNPGMLLLAGERLGADLSRSIMVGDKDSDMQAGARGGLAEGWLVGGHESSRRDSGFPVKPLNTRADHQALATLIETM